MKTIVCVMCLLLSWIFSFGQNNLKAYQQLIKKGGVSYRASDYATAANAYKEACKTLQGIYYSNDYYYAARANAMAGDVDNAFLYLNAIMISKPTTNNQSILFPEDLIVFNHSSIISDPALIALHTDKRWNTLLEQIKIQDAKVDATLNKPLMYALDSLFYSSIQIAFAAHNINNAINAEASEVQLAQSEME